MRTLLKFAAAVSAAALLAVTAFTGSLETQAPTASAAQADYFLKLDGIDGEIQIESFSWGVTTHRDAATGQSSGKRQHQPLVIRKRIDKSSPVLYKMIQDTKSRYVGTVTIVKRSEGQEQYKVVFQDIVIMSFEQKGDVGAETEIVSWSWGANQMTTR